MALVEFPKGEPPTLSEPLVGLKTGGINNLLAWVHNAVSNLAAGLEAQKERQVSVEDELRLEYRNLRERVGFIESRFDSHSPAASDRGFGGPRGTPSVGTRAGTPLGTSRHGTPAHHSHVDLGPAGVRSRSKAGLDATAEGYPAIDATHEQREDLPVFMDRVDATLEDLCNRVNALMCGSPPNADGVTSDVDGTTLRPATPGSAVTPGGLNAESRHFGERLRQLEESLDHFRNQHSRRLNTSDNLVGMRLETVELELTSCARMKDLDGQKKDIEALRTQQEQALNEAVRNLGQQLRVDLAGRADQLREGLQTASDAVQRAAVASREGSGLLSGPGLTGLEPSTPSAGLPGFGETSGTSGIAVPGDLGSVENRMRSVEDMCGKLHDDVRQLKESAGKTDSDALKKGVALEPQVQSLTLPNHGTGGMKESSDTPAAVAVVEARVQALERDASSVQARVDEVAEEVRDLKLAAQKDTMGAALQHASDDQIEQIVHSVQDAIKVSDEAKKHVTALSKEVQQLGVEALWSEVRALRDTLSNLPDLASSSPAPASVAAEEARDLPFTRSRELPLSQSPISQGSPKSGQPVGPSSEDARPGTAEAMQGQIQNLGEIASLQSRMQALVEEVRLIREATLNQGVTPVSSTGKRSRSHGTVGGSPSHGAAGASPSQSPHHGNAAAGDQVSEANGTFAKQTTPPNIPEHESYKNIGQREPPPGPYLEQRDAPTTNSVDKLDGSGALREMPLDGDILIQRLTDMEQDLRSLHGKLESVQGNVLREAAANASALPNESRIATLEQRVAELSNCQPLSTAETGPSVASDGGANPEYRRGFTETTGAAAAPEGVGKDAAALKEIALAAAGGDDSGAVAAAVAAVEAVANVLGARTAEVEGQVQRLLEDMLELRGNKPSRRKSGLAAQTSHGVGGGAGDQITKAQSATANGGQDAVEGVADAMAAVASVQARADELAQQLELDHEEFESGSSDVRLAALESKIELMAQALDSVRSTQREMLSYEPGGGKIPDGANGSTGGSESHSPVSAIAATAAAAAIGDNILQSPMARSAVSPTAGSAVDAKVQKLGALLDGVSRAVKNLEARPEVSDKVIAECDRRIETRMTAIWNELTQHAKAAATRADKLEQQFSIRLERHDQDIQQLKTQAEKNTDFIDTCNKLAKQIEWLNWRISWLEWATGGEKRGFSRPLDDRAILPHPLPPPMTAAATAFAQPLTEDVELWAREPGGRQRMRRQIHTAAPSGRQDARGDVARLDATDAIKGANIRGSQSTGRLPKISS